uniref:Uncharacterized protein n=1 Tax=Oryzias latipes TaxID=8090 RepID=A0A3P9HBX0_ORYLA
MLMQPNANWEEFLTPAPLSIAIMGELVLFSSGPDFSMNKNPPKDGFKHIKYPESFRAGVMQVCGSGWQAFNIAHKNMDQIRIHTASVPEHMKDAVKILYQGSDEMIEKLFPNELKSILNMANDCVELADGVEKKYNDVICLIQELLEACINAEHIYGEDLEKVKNKMKQNKLREQSARELNEKYTEAMEAMEKQVEEAEEEFKSSMNSLPTGMELVAMDMAHTLTQTISTMGSAVFTLAGQDPAKFESGLPAMAATAGNLAQPEGGPQSKTETVDSLSDIEVYSKSSQILILTKTILSYMNKVEINWKELYDQKNESNFEFIKQQFKRISTDIAKAPKSKAKDKALSLCNDGIAISEQLSKYSPDQKWDKKTTEKLIKEAKKLHQDAMQFDTESKMKCGVPAIAPTPPMMAKAQAKAGQQSAGEQASEHAWFCIEQSREQLKLSREEYNKAKKYMETTLRELTDILADMHIRYFKEIDFDKAIKMLIKGMDAMYQGKKQWQKMVRFFQMVANIVKTCLSKTRKKFGQRAEHVQTLSYNSKLFTKDLLYNQAFQASNIASLVHMISGTYCEVSNKYLMDGVSSLGKLMSMDKDKPEFLQERQKLQNSCKEAQDSILKLVLSNKKELEKNTDTRMKEIEGGLKAILLAFDPEETTRIQEIVQASMTDKDLDELV